MKVEVTPVGPESTETVLDVIYEAFAARPPLDPPSDASAETAATLRARLASHDGLLACLDGRPCGALLMDPEGDNLHLRRFGLLPVARGHGVAASLLTGALRQAAAEGFFGVTVLAREELPATVEFWRHQGFVEVDRHPPYVELWRPVYGGRFVVPEAESMQHLGRTVAGWLAAGDLVVLNGDLGAGKTTFTQGLGDGLGVRGPVTSPTFVIARVHPTECGGPDLVHVDAYRLGGSAELDDLDLDVSLEQAVTVVEWGGGLAEGLADSRLEVRISTEDPDGSGEGGLDPRRVEITPVGPRWGAA